MDRDRRYIKRRSHLIGSTRSFCQKLIINLQRMHIDHSEYTILLADDSVSNLEKMKSLLAGENFKLIPTLEADEVFLLAKLRLPDMIIIRLALEDGKGCYVV